MRKRFNNVRSFVTSRCELLEERVPLAGDFDHGVALDQNDSEFARLTADLFNWGDNGQKVYYGPTITKAMDGSLLVFVEGRFHHQDDRVNNILMRRSTDGGNTWSEAQTLVSLPPWGEFMAMGVPL